MNAKIRVLGLLVLLTFFGAPLAFGQSRPVQVQVVPSSPYHDMLFKSGIPEPMAPIENSAMINSLVQATESQRRMRLMEEQAQLLRQQRLLIEEQRRALQRQQNQ